MFETVRARCRMVRHIRDLFRRRSDSLTLGTWACVIRQGELIVAKRFLIRGPDHEVMWALLRPGQLPSYFQTNQAVRKHWSVLKPIAMELWRRPDRAEAPARSSVHAVDFGT